MSTPLLTRPAADMERHELQYLEKVVRYQFVAWRAPWAAELFMRIYEGRASVGECIEGRCLECAGFSIAAVTECTRASCPLFNLRPYQADRAKARGVPMGDD